MMNRADADAALLTAVSNGDVDGVRAAFAAGANPDAENAEGKAACAVAAGDDDCDVLALLLDAGADLEHPFWNGGLSADVLAVYKAAVKKTEERRMSLREAQRLDGALEQAPGLPGCQAWRL